MSKAPSVAKGGSPQCFATTHWSVVLQAREEDAQAAAEAVAELCRTYWPPANTYIRHWGYEAHDAEDLTQEFFARFLEKEQYRKADRTRGKFRTFLLTSIKRFMINDRERRCARKRGGNQVLVSLDDPPMEPGGRPIEPLDARTAEWAYERAWALALLAQVRSRLQDEFAATQQGKRFEVLEKFLPGTTGELTYAQAATCLGLTESTVRAEVCRLKNRYRKTLRQEIAHTVAQPDEIEEELRHLFTALTRPAGAFAAARQIA